MKRALIILAGLGLASAASAASMAELDANGDGYVTYEEMVTVMPDTTEETFTLVDANADGLVEEAELTAAQEAGLIPAS